MAKEDTIENRVYLFESLAASFLSAEGHKLSSGSEAERARALRALADLAYVSCVVADTGAQSPEEVRRRVTQSDTKRGQATFLARDATGNPRRKK